MRIRLLAPIACLLTAITPTAPASAGGASTQLVSRFQGIDAVHGSCSTFGGHAISGDGRFVVFTVDDDALPGADGTRDVYVRNLVQGTTRLVSKNTAGAPANADSSDAVAISGSGRFVAFSSSAENLPGGTGTTDVYLHDTTTGTTRLMSKTAGGVPADGDSETVSVSSNGRSVAFESDADNIGGAAGFIDVFLHDSQSGDTRLMARGPAGGIGKEDSFYASVSTDGRFVAFTSRSDNFSPDDDNAVSNCFARGPLG